MDDEREKLAKLLTENQGVLKRQSLPTESSLEDQRQREQIMLERARDVNSMRKRWSFWLLIFIGFIVVFDASFVILIGLDVLVFKSDDLILAFVAENLFKVAGLAYIVVNFLFDRNKE